MLVVCWIHFKIEKFYGKKLLKSTLGILIVYPGVIKGQRDYIENERFARSTRTLPNSGRAGSATIGGHVSQRVLLS